VEGESIGGYPAACDGYDTSLIEHVFPPPPTHPQPRSHRSILASLVSNPPPLLLLQTSFSFIFTFSFLKSFFAAGYSFQYNKKIISN
jgi:hypothetical protein